MRQRVYRNKSIWERGDAWMGGMLGKAKSWKRDGKRPEKLGAGDFWKVGGKCPVRGYLPGWQEEVQEIKPDNRDAFF